MIRLYRVEVKQVGDIDYAADYMVLADSPETALDIVATEQSKIEDTIRISEYDMSEGVGVLSFSVVLHIINDVQESDIPEA